MVKNVIGLKFLVVLCFLAIIAGCSKKVDSGVIEEELAKTQEDLEYWKGRYEAISMDLRNAKSSQRDLGTQLNTVGDATQTTEQQLQVYAQQLVNLQAQVQQLNAVVTEQENIILEQETIISEQEAALEEFIGGVTEETPYYYY